MNKFEQLVESKTKEYGVSELVENMGASNGGAMNANTGQSMDSEMPMADPTMDAQPAPEAGAETQEPVYDKPYQDLAGLLYEALRMNFDDLEQSQQRKILALHPEDIKSDQQGVSIFKAFESVLNDQEGPEPEDQVEGSADGFGPAAG
jgi:hypothetical protein